jgi:catechol 2,3-dioxygenase-like lactoylglutathione lyase family enzyme
MDWKIELEAIPVTDVDRAKAFYVDQVGFHADHDHQVNEALRFVQLTPPGSACSIVMGTGITEMAPGSQKGVQIVVADVEAARQQLIAHGVQASDVDVQPWAPSSPSATPMEIPGRCSSSRRGGRSFVSPQRWQRRSQYYTPGTLPQIPGHCVGLRAGMWGA